jgi:hypothetical protein
LFEAAQENGVTTVMPMSNDELTKHAIRTGADMLQLTEKIDGLDERLTA